MFLKLSTGSLCALALLAQTPSPSPAPQALAIQMGDPSQFGPVGITTVMAGPLATVTGAPYSADAVTERLQTLADGNRIVQKTTGAVARDAQGRVRRDEALPGFITAKGANPHIVAIDDPVAGVSWRLDAQNKTAIKMPLPTAGKFTLSMPPPLPPTGEKMLFFSSATMPKADLHFIQNPGSEPTTKTDLGNQTIEGVNAHGTRTTRTLPAGAVGNEQPIVITSESWYSPDLKVLVMTKVDDPRMGQTTYQLTNLQRGEPLPDLFLVPADYTVKSAPQPNVLFRTNK